MFTINEKPERELLSIKSPQYFTETGRDPARSPEWLQRDSGKSQENIYKAGLPTSAGK